MARKIENFTISDGSRDQGKTFVLTEMPASRAEAWAMRALLALMNSGAQLPEGFERSGMAGVAELGLKALSGLSWETLEPLMSEMMSCVQFMPDTSKPNVVRALFEEDIEEVSTRIQLRVAVWKLHVAFFKSAAPSLFGELQARAAGNNSTSPNV